MKNLNNVLYASFTGADYMEVKHNGITYHCFYELNWSEEQIEIQQIIFDGVNIQPALEAIDNTLSLWYDAIDTSTGFHEKASQLYYREQLAAM